MAPRAEIVADPAELNGMHQAEAATLALATPLPPAVTFVILEYVIVAVNVSAEVIRLAVKSKAFADPPDMQKAPDRIHDSPSFVTMYAISLPSYSL